MKYFLLGASALALAACGSSSGTSVSADLSALVAPGGDVDAEFDGTATAVNSTRPGVGVYRIRSGAIDGVQSGRATWDVDAAIAAAPTANATFTGGYSYYLFGDVNGSGAGSATVEFDAATSKVSGTMGSFTIAGDVTGNAIDGTASYNGIDGVMGGAISVDGAIGAFAGDDGTNGYVGGFSVGP